VSTFLSSVAVFLSTLALLCGGYAAYQVHTFQQTVGVNTTSSFSNPTQTASPTEVSTPSPATTTPASAVNAAISPGQFVQPAFGNKAKVELLSVKRIKDPETGNRDVVNVQMRIRRAADDNSVTATEVISVSSATARNPDTSETYKGVKLERATGPVSLSQLRPNSSADAYVWLKVTDGVNNLDIFVPDTGAFKNVPISN
jgi:hypothetical protein